MPFRRIALLAISAFLVVGLGVTVWQGYQLLRELSRAESSVSTLRSALKAGDVTGRDRAIANLQTAATAAQGRTDGAWWGALTKLPLVGDDAQGLRVLASTLALVSSDGVAPMADSVDQLDAINVGDRIDLDLVSSLQHR